MFGCTPQDALASALSTFNKTLERLEDVVKRCDNRTAEITDEISDLSNESFDLHNTAMKATGVATKLRELLG